MEPLKDRQIMLADTSDSGWREMEEYEKHQLAEQSDDEKRILQDTARVERMLKQNLELLPSRPAPFTIRRPDRGSASPHLPSGQ